MNKVKCVVVESQALLKGVLELSLFSWVVYIWKTYIINIIDVVYFIKFCGAVIVQILSPFIH